MTGRPADTLASMARDVQWALDALRAKEPDTAERILAHAWETYVINRESAATTLAETPKNV